MLPINPAAQGVGWLSKDDTNGRTFIGRGVALIDESGAFHQCVKDLGSLPVEHFRIGKLDDEWFDGTEDESRHSVTFPYVCEAVDPRVHVATIELWEAKCRSALDVECISGAHGGTVKLDPFHSPPSDTCWRLTL